MSAAARPEPLAPEVLVLEIGSGSHPWPRADVLVDRFLEDHEGQRGGGALHRDRRPLVIAAGERLPFKDKAFDYVYASHVVEHATDLGAMLREMSRVARAGFIECPNPLLERLLDPPQHRWYIANAGSGLLAAAKTPASSLTRREDRFYFHLLSDHFIVRRHWGRFVTRLHWQDSIDCCITDDPQQVMDAQAIEADPALLVERSRRAALARCWVDACGDHLRRRLARSGAARRLWQGLRRLRAVPARLRTPRVQGPAFDRLLCCPGCRADLQRNSAGYRCSACARDFPDHGGVAVLLA